MTDFPTAPLAPGLVGAGGGAVEKSLSASHTEIQTPPLPATDMAQVRLYDAVQIAVLKKAMDIEAQGAMQLVQAASQVIKSNPPNLGNQIDTFA